MSKKKSPRFTLRIRSYPEGKFVSVWLLRHDGPASAGLLWGEVVPQAAEEIVQALGLLVEREGNLFENVTPVQLPECLPVVKQRELFDDA
jgi:hypothetical protein